MRTLVEQYLTKGPRVHYHVALQELEGRHEVVYRWANPKGIDVKRVPCESEARGRAMVQWKLEELASRGYDKRPDPRAARAAREVDESLAMVATVLPPAQPADAGASAPAADSLASTLERRRREASWRLN